MSKRDVLEVAVKLVGLYAVFAFLQSIAWLAGIIASEDKQFVGSKTMYVSLACLAAVLYLVFAVAFLWRGRRIAEFLTQDSESSGIGERPAMPACARLGFWVRVLGLYFFVGGISEVVSAIAQAGITVRSPFGWSQVAGHVVQLAVSVVFIFRSERVSQFVERYAESGKRE
jgi:hypothetical protein